jgi:hypothetical protein
MRRCVLLVSLALVAPAGAQPVAEPAVPPRPVPRWLAHATFHHGIAIVDDTFDTTGSAMPTETGANDPGVALGFQAGIQYRMTAEYSVGIGLDLTFSEHNSKATDRARVKYTNAFPVVVGRHDLGRFALAGWLGYHRLSRAITEPGGGVLGSDSTIARDTLWGFVGGAGFVVKIKPPAPVMIELGPFAQTARFSGGGDTTGTVNVLVLGLLAQVVYNGPSIRGDDF